jgi:hypothetical protein
MRKRDFYNRPIHAVNAGRALLAPRALACYFEPMHALLLPFCGSLSHLVRRFGGALLAASLVVMPAVAAYAAEPLVTIRFNQPNIHFEQQVHGAISKAVAVKPQVTFEVVSQAPASANPAYASQAQQIASQNTRRVVEAMLAMGVPPGRIAVRGANTPGIPVDATQIFAK